MPARRHRAAPARQPACPPRPRLRPARARARGSTPAAPAPRGVTGQPLLFAFEQLRVRQLARGVRPIIAALGERGERGAHALLLRLGLAPGGERFAVTGPRLLELAQPIEREQPGARAEQALVR